MMRLVRKCIALALAAILFLAAATAGAEVFVNRRKPEDWEERNLLRITAMDFYQNDAFILECGGKVMLLDGGAKKHWKDYAVYLEEHGMTHVDILFNTHPHDDHLEAVYYLVKNGKLTADRFISPFQDIYRDEKKYHQNMVALLKEKGIPFHWMRELEELELGDARMVLYRRSDAGDTNAKSGALHIRFGDATIFMTADISGETERWFLEQYGAEAMKADILKAPHHGIVRMVPEFINAVDPRLVIITNRKTANVKEQLDNRGIANLCTSMGIITLETDGTDWYVQQGDEIIEDEPEEPAEGETEEGEPAAEGGPGESETAGEKVPAEVQ